MIWTDFFTLGAMTMRRPSERLFDMGPEYEIMRDGICVGTAMDCRPKMIRKLYFHMIQMFRLTM